MTLTTNNHSREDLPENTTDHITAKWIEQMGIQEERD